SISSIPNGWPLDIGNPPGTIEIGTLSDLNFATVGTGQLVTARIGPLGPAAVQQPKLSCRDVWWHMLDVLHLHHLALILERFLRVIGVTERTLCKTPLYPIVVSGLFHLNGVAKFRIFRTPAPNRICCNFELLSQLVISRSLPAHCLGDAGKLLPVFGFATSPFHI